MNYISAENIGHSYGEKVLFSQLSTGIAQGQKVALVGINGSGKSTLLRVLAGIEPPETGEVAHMNGLKLAYLSQLPAFDPELRVLEAIMQTDDPMISLVRDYEECLALSTANPEAAERLPSLIEEMEAHNAWNYEAQVKQILGKLGLENFDKRIGELSGGQKKRVGLAATLLMRPDLAILDEPTNHLDLDAIEWLEEYLSASNMSILMVTHDRYFLESVTNEIMELNNGKLFHYQGSYSYYLEMKEDRALNEKAEVDKARNLMRKELEWIRRQPKARGTKAKYRVDAFEGIREKATRDINQDVVELDLIRRRQGGKILEMEKVEKSFGERQVIPPFSYTFKRGERVGIVGKNGAGKSTFLNLITGEISPDSGTLDPGVTTVFGYYKQQEPSFSSEQKVIDVVREVAEVIPLSDGSKITAGSMLTRFNFPSKQQYEKVAKLSGGEKRRLQLLLVLMRNPNFLILDEPTNDLDLETLRVLEDFLMAFDGCLLIVTHDRYFMDRLVDHLFIFEEGRMIRDFNGKYARYREELRENRSDSSREKGRDKAGKESEPKAEKLSFNEKREMEQLEKQMEKLNRRKEELTRQMNDETTDHETLVDMGSEISKINKDLDDKELRWLELSEKN